MIIFPHQNYKKMYFSIWSYKQFCNVGLKFPGERLQLTADQTYSVGTKSTDFPLLKDGKVDKSVSRSHATVTVNFSKSNSQLSLQVKTKYY
jgi:hypothetical protein